MVNETKHIIKRKIMLIEAGYTVKTLAEKIKLTKQAVNPAILGQSTSYRCQRRIAIALQKPMVEIWPELYSVIPAADFDRDAICHDSGINEINESVN